MRTPLFDTPIIQLLFDGFFHATFIPGCSSIIFHDTIACADIHIFGLLIESQRHHIATRHNGIGRSVLCDHPCSIFRYNEDSRCGSTQPSLTFIIKLNGIDSHGLKQVFSIVVINWEYLATIGRKIIYLVGRNNNHSGGGSHPNLSFFVLFRTIYGCSSKRLSCCGSPFVAKDYLVVRRIKSTLIIY